MLLGKGTFFNLPQLYSGDGVKQLVNSPYNSWESKSTWDYQTAEGRLKTLIYWNVLVQGGGGSIIHPFWSVLVIQFWKSIKRFTLHVSALPPPAQMKLLCRLKFGPSDFLRRSWFWQELKSTRGKSTFFRTFEVAFFPAINKILRLRSMLIP